LDVRDEMERIMSQSYSNFYGVYNIQSKHSLSDTQFKRRTDVIDAYFSVDTDGDGKLNKREMRNVLEAYFKSKNKKKKINENKIKTMLNQFTFKDDKITLSSYLRVMADVQGGGGDDTRKNYEEEMCKTQIGMLKDFEEIINKIVTPK